MPTCARCKLEKGQSDFYSRSRGNGITAYCKSCNYEVTMARQRRMKTFSIGYKGGRCEACGYSAYDGALEFHHRDPAIKEFSLGQARSRRIEALIAELDKCALLCVNCHREAHHQLGPKPSIVAVDMDTPIRRCPRCAENLPTIAFYNRRDGKGLTVYCRSCLKSQILERQQRLKKQALAYKGDKCQRCGYARSAAALEFHHRDTTAKEFHLSHAKVTEFERVKSELDKCDLLCANCHREEHARINGILN